MLQGSGGCYTGRIWQLKLIVWRFGVLGEDLGFLTLPWLVSIMDIPDRPAKKRRLS